MYHDRESARHAEEEFDRIFVRKDLPDDIAELPSRGWGRGPDSRLLTETGLAASNGEARRLIEQGGVSIDGQRITDQHARIDVQGGAVLKVGKRKFVRVVPASSLTHSYVSLRRKGYKELYVPGKICFTKGVGRHKDYLQSFELALRDAKIEKCNLVTVSSIYPPGCKRIPTEEGLKLLQPGQITFAVMARNATNEPNRLVAASIGVATPADTTQYGYLSEHHPFGETDEKAGEYAEDLAATMLASTLGVEFDPGWRGMNGKRSTR